LTGWAQIKGHYGTKMADELEKLQYDLYYVRHQSIALDLVILLKTIAVILRLAGR
jgi:lipopolysaccharide/colanic/teichoic acid biosynthesis glycosyltransferase